MNIKFKEPFYVKNNDEIKFSMVEDKKGTKVKKVELNNKDITNKTI